MLYVFKCPMTPVLDDAGLPLVKDGEIKVRAVHHAGECQLAIDAVIGACEHSPEVTYRKDGVYALTRAKVLAPGLDPRMVKLHEAMPNLQLITEADYTARVVGEQRLAGLEVKFSPSLDGLFTLEDFPSGFAFGNGVSCGVKLPNRDGVLVNLAWCVLAAATAVAVRNDLARYETLRQLMET